MLGVQRKPLKLVTRAIMSPERNGANDVTGTLTEQLKQTQNKSQKVRACCARKYRTASNIITWLVHMQA